MSGQTSVVSILVHAVVFAAALYFLGKAMEGFKDSKKKQMKPEGFAVGFSGATETETRKYILLFSGWLIAWVFWMATSLNIINFTAETPDLAVGIIKGLFPLVSLALGVAGAAL